MKRIIFGTITIVFLSGININAGILGKRTKVEIKVIDDEGDVVKDAEVHGYFLDVRKKDGGGDVFCKHTDENGIIITKGELFDGKIEGWIVKKGYYRSYYKKIPKKIKGKLFYIEVILRRIKSPHPMYAKIADIYLPTTNMWYGYDFEIGDLVEPYGKGKVSDVQLKIKGKYTPGPITFSYICQKLYLKFDEHEKDGVILSKKYMYSEYKGPYEAPTSGYIKILDWEYERTFEKVLIDRKSKDDDCLVFRVRSKLDNNGKLKEARYGKIYGQIKFSVTEHKQNVILVYFFNKNANDRRLEFEPKENLFKNLSTMEKIGIMVR